MVRSSLAAVLLLAGCSSTAEVRVFGEAFAEEGLPSSSLQDNWSIEFSELVVAIGDVRVSGEADLEVAGSHVFDVAAESGLHGHLLETVAMPSGDYDAVHYRIATPANVAGGNASEAQAKRLIDGGLAVFVAGEAARGQTRVSFEWGFPIDPRVRLCDRPARAR